jgi:hypothetical protein
MRGGRDALLSSASQARLGGSGAAWLVAALCMAWPGAASGQAGADDPARLNVLEMLGRCDTAPGDEIVVCGRRNQDRYRLPLLGRRDSGVGAGNVRGEVPRASADATASGGCGIFQHQRRCSRAEMEEAGYFRGRDPVSFLGDLVTVLIDPDAEVRPPPPIP